jgi:hypothetical protein
LNQELIDKCRYFKGEESCPASLKEAGKEYLWFYEMKWVELKGNYDDPGEFDDNNLSSFEKDDGVPISLKKMLFNRYIQDVWSIREAIPHFKKWYFEQYMSN